ncbi:hypothetical protein ACTXT7_000660 [Hymenolepis weldensis]
MTCNYRNTYGDIYNHYGNVILLRFVSCIAVFPTVLISKSYRPTATANSTTGYPTMLSINDDLKLFP